MKNTHYSTLNIANVGVSNMTNDSLPDIDVHATAAMARELGWGKFNLFIYEVPEPDDSDKKGTLSVWMECREWSSNCNSDDIFMQINLDNATKGGLRMCVFAIRYRICTGWHRFTAHTAPAKRRKEATRLSPFFEASHFINPKNRRNYRMTYPQSYGYTWKRVREEGVPEL